MILFFPDKLILNIYNLDVVLIQFTSLKSWLNSEFSNKALEEHHLFNIIIIFNLKGTHPIF